MSQALAALTQDPRGCAYECCHQWDSVVDLWQVTRPPTNDRFGSLAAGWLSIIAPTAFGSEADIQTLPFSMCGTPVRHAQCAGFGSAPIKQL